MRRDECHSHALILHHKYLGLQVAVRTGPLRDDVREINFIVRRLILKKQSNLAFHGAHHDVRQRLNVEEVGCVGDVVAAIAVLDGGMLGDHHWLLVRPAHGGYHKRFNQTLLM